MSRLQKKYEMPTQPLGQGNRRNPFLAILEEQVPGDSNLDAVAAKLGLVMKVVYSDMVVDDGEKAALRELIKQYLSLDDQKAGGIMQALLSVDPLELEMAYLGEILNEHSDESQRREFLSDLFKIAHADGEYAMLEEKDIRLISKFLFLSHRDFTEERLSARKEAESEE